MADVISMPKLGFDMAEGKLVHWLKAVGETVNKGEIIADIETDKATVEVESTYSGVVARHYVPEGEVVPVGTPIALITAPGEEVKDDEIPAGPVEGKATPEKSTAVTAEAVKPAETLPQEGERVKASPLAKRMASEHDLNLASISGTGPGGRIVRRDIEDALKAASAAPAAPSVVPMPVAVPAVSSAPAATPIFIPTEVPADQHKPVDRLRSIIGKRMAESKQQVPHFYITHVYDVEAMLSLRQQVNSLLPENAKISVNDFVIKAVALALRQYPNLNSSISGNEIVQYGHVNIGVAVGMDGGLLTVVCRDADQKPIRIISAEIREMVERARTGKMRPADIEGSTFSVSNLGMYDVEHFVAIINPPEAAILAVGSAQKVPVVVGDELKVAARMKVTISADHRVTDGVEAAQFLKALARYLENPMSLML